MRVPELESERERAKLNGAIPLGRQMVVTITKSQHIAWPDPFIRWVQSTTFLDGSLDYIPRASCVLPTTRCSLPRFNVQRPSNQGL